MSSTNENTTGVTLLSPPQIELLQQQIRQFKNLGKRFSESKVPKLIELIQQSSSVSQTSKPTTKEHAKEPSTAKETGPAPVTTVVPPAAPAAPAQPTLSWQCFNSLLFCGPNKFPQDNAISFSSSVRETLFSTPARQTAFVILYHSNLSLSN